MVKKVALFSGISVLLLVAVFYGAFSIILKVTESKWLGEPPFHEATDFSSIAPHEFSLINSGADSLALRLRKIEAATKSIDLEFFIYDLDTTSRIVTQAIARKAKEGVKVRVLVDFSLPVFKLRPAYAKVMRDAGIEVKYYNTASIVRFFRLQHRTHRKMLILDGESAFIGGRNIADDYFDLSHHYNFLDSDAMITGPAVAAMRDSFDLYWDSTWAVAPNEDGEEVPGSEDFSIPNDEDKKTYELMHSIVTKEVTSTCNDIRFVTDYPGSGVNFRRVFPAITDVMASAKSSVLAESPYFVLREGGHEVIHQLTDRGIKLDVLTNSLRSTDAYYTVAPLVLNLSDIAQKGFRLYAYGGHPLEGYERFTPRSQRWGVHAKRAVVDDDTILIGTYNIDPRSANLNSELMVVCRGNKDLASAMRQSIEHRIRQSNIVLDGTNPASWKALTGGASFSQKVMMLLSVPLSSLFAFLL